MKMKPIPDITKSTTGRNLAIAGAVCQLGPIIGLAGTVIGMMGAFNAIGSSGAGIGDPSMLSSSIGHVLISTAIGFIVGIIGLVLLIVSLTGCRYRAEWFFWFLIVYGVLALTVFPVGTAFGVFFLVYGLSKRHEFLRPASEARENPPSSNENA
jgi:hypothetical protein